MQKHNRLDFVETNLLPAIKSHQQDLLKNLDQYVTKFNEDKTRLIEVREEKRIRLEKELESKIFKIISFFFINLFLYF